MERMLCCSRISWKVWCSQRQKTCMPSSFKGGFRSSIHNLKVHEVDPSAAWWGLVHCMSGGCACFTALCQQLLSCESLSRYLNFTNLHLPILNRNTPTCLNSIVPGVCRTNFSRRGPLHAPAAAVFSKAFRIRAERSARSERSGVVRSFGP